MKIIKELEDLQPEMENWRRDIHAHPEIAFEEHRTAKIVADKLESFGIEVETGIAGTGVVGTLKKGKGAFVFQDSALLPWRRVQGNVELKN